MIDIEPILFTEIATKLRVEIPGIFVTGTIVDSPQNLPCAAISETSNTTYQRTLDSEFKENHANIMWQAEAFSNLVVGAKAHCKSIMAIIDEIMISRNFARTFSDFIDNSGSGIRRMVARYTAVVSTAGEIYRR